MSWWMQGCTFSFRRLVCCAFVIFGCVAFRNEHHCSESMSKAVHVMPSQLDRGDNFNVMLEMPLTRNWTFCYDVMVVEDNNGVPALEYSGRTVFISFVGIIQEYTIKLAYNFSIPIINLKCTCSCMEENGQRKPRGPECVNEEHDFPSYQFSAAGHHAPDCSIPEEANYLCCKIHLYFESRNPEYLAMYVDHPRVFYEVRVGVLNEEKDVIDVNTLHISVGTEATFTPIGMATVSGIKGLRPSLMSGWYFKDYKTGSLRSKEPINDWHEKSFNKLGWAKFESFENKMLPLNFPDLEKSLSLDINSCRDSDISWTSSSSYYKSQPLEKFKVGQNLNEFYQQVKQNNDKFSITKITLGAPLGARLQLNLNLSSTTIFQYPNSGFENFVASLSVNKFGVCELKLFLIKARGNLLAVVTEEEGEFRKTENITLTVPSVEPVSLKREYRLLQNFNKSANVCVFTFNESIIKCTMINNTDSMSYVNPSLIVSQFSEVKSAPEFLDENVSSAIAISLSLALLFMISAGFFFYRRRKIKFQTNTAESMPQRKTPCEQSDCDSDEFEHPGIEDTVV